MAVGAVAIMAGGKGTRMQSELTKVRHPVAGLPMLVYPVLAAQHAGAEKTIVITGPDDDFASDCARVSAAAESTSDRDGRNAGARRLDATARLGDRRRRDHGVGDSSSGRAAAAARFKRAPIARCGRGIRGRHSLSTTPS